MTESLPITSLMQPIIKKRLKKNKVSITLQPSDTFSLAVPVTNIVDWNTSVAFVEAKVDFPVQVFIHN